MPRWPQRSVQLSTPRAVTLRRHCASILSKRLSRYWIGGFIRYENVARTAFADSPLVRTNASYSAGLGFAYIFHRSKRMVETNDDE